MIDAPTTTSWCLIKQAPDFPYIGPGADLDVFARDPDEFVRSRVEASASFISQRGHKIRVYRVNRHTNHLNADFLTPNGLTLKLDVYGDLPSYQRVRLKRSFFDVVLDRAVPARIEIGGRTVNYRVPQKDDAAILRYVEYCEHYWTGPEKPWHLASIERTFPTGPEQDAFLERLHHYTAMPHVAARPKRPRSQSRIGYVAQRLRNTPVERWPALARRGLARIQHRTDQRRPRTPEEPN